MSRWCSALAVSAFGWLACLSAATAQTFPDKPVRFIVALAPGGGTDIIARLVGDKLSQKWGQSVVIENRAGALGTIAADYVAKQPADGYTVLVSILSTLTIARRLVPNLPFDTYNDFAGVTALAYTPFVWLTHPGQPYRTFNQLIEQARKDDVPFGNAGAGSLQHLYGEMFNLRYQTKFRNVPYKGQGPALQDLVGGHLPVLFGDIGGTKSFVEAGQARPLAVTGTSRSASLPDVPTLAELGYQGFERGGWFAMWVAAKTDHAIIAKMATDVGEALRSPEVAPRIVEFGWEVGGNSPEEFEKIWKETGDSLNEVLDKADIKLN